MIQADPVTTVLVRADGGASIGSGHVIRSLTLAGHLAERGAHPVFAIRDDRGALVERIERTGYRVIRMPSIPADRSLLAGAWDEQVQEADAEEVSSNIDLTGATVIVDHYGLDATWERAIRTRAARIIVLDDLANRSHDADVLVDQNWYGPDTGDRYRHLVGPGTLQLLGPRYAILQDEYAELRLGRRPPSHPPGRIVVSFGGSDPTGETQRVVEALSQEVFQDLDVDVVLGSRHVLTESLERLLEARSRTTLHVAVPTMAPLLARSDLAIGASGSGTWERMCLDVPALVTTTSLAHSGVTRALAEAGLTCWAGIGGEVDVDDYGRLLAGLIERRRIRTVPLVDGYGARRIALALTPGVESLVVRPADAGDQPVFLGEDRSGLDGMPSHLGGPAEWEAAGNAFRSGMSDPAQLWLVIEVDGTPVGRVHAVLGHSQIEISYSIDDCLSGVSIADRLVPHLQNNRWSVDEGVLQYSAGVPEDSRHRSTGADSLSGVLTIPVQGMPGRP
jgi:UDP-2,4-diacetamido-2,4,6-trideoxy-beta-L-altropyranose hydrolase